MNGEIVFFGMVTVVLCLVGAFLNLARMSSTKMTPPPDSTARLWTMVIDQHQAMHEMVLRVVENATPGAKNNDPKP